MNNILRTDTNTIENIKKEITQLQSVLDITNSKLLKVRSLVDLNIESDNIAKLKKNIMQNINNLENLINNLTTFSNNVEEINNNLTQSLINLRTTYKKINTN